MTCWGDQGSSPVPQTQSSGCLAHAHSISLGLLKFISLPSFLFPFSFFFFFNHYIFLKASLLCLVVTFIFKITTNTERKKRTETSQWKEGELSKTEHLLWTTCSINWSLCWTFFLFIFNQLFIITGLQS